jgi:hypothetical protein
MKSMKLRDVPGGQVFSYPGSSDRYLKLHNNKFLKPPETALSLTELAAKFGEGKILYCNPESQVVLHD